MQRYTGTFAYEPGTQWVDERYPNGVPMGIVYVFNGELASFQCPCGCKEHIHLKVDPDEGHPRWALNVDDNGLVSLSPSIHWVCGCRSHFFITNGRILWV